MCNKINLKPVTVMNGDKTDVTAQNVRMSM